MNSQLNDRLEKKKKMDRSILFPSPCSYNDNSTNRKKNEEEEEEEEG